MGSRLTEESERRFSSALVLGLGASGEAAARLLLGEGTRVTVADRADNAELRERAAALTSAGAVVQLGEEGLPWGRYDIGIVSPGLPVETGWVREAESRGLKIVSELELGGRRCRCPLLAVTGTNGKSTMTKLCAEALAGAGFRTAIAGNYGTPLCRVASQAPAPQWVVVEVSSFQLERSDLFRPKVGVLLNVQPNHLDRHGDMRTYMNAKLRLFANMRSGDTAVVPRDLLDEARAGAGAPRWVTFGALPVCDAWYDKGVVRLRDKSGAAAAIDVSDSPFANSVLGSTAAAAAAALGACGAGPECLESAARRFEPLPHRMTHVCEKRGVLFVDDSKATNLAAMAAALRMLDRPVRLIAGGLLKEKDLISVEEILAKKVRVLYVIGNAAESMAEAWGRAVPCKRCGTLEQAVQEAWRDARAGEVVLLSPACASFDQFRGFGERGDRFSDYVKSISEEN